MKKLLLLLPILFVLTGCQSSLLGATETPEELYNRQITNLQSNIDTEENNSFDGRTRYKPINKNRLSDGTEYSVDKIVIWDGHDQPKSVGYQVRIKDKNNRVKSYGTGDQTSTMSHDWQEEIINATSTQ